MISTEKLPEKVVCSSTIDLRIYKSGEEKAVVLNDSQNSPCGVVMIRIYMINIARGHDILDNSFFPLFLGKPNNIERENIVIEENELPLDNFERNLPSENVEKYKVSKKVKHLPPVRKEVSAYVDVPHNVDNEILRILLSYGFEKKDCIKCLIETNNNKLEALERLLEMDKK